MGEAKKLFERINGKKRLRKDQWLIVVLAGVLLCVISLPVEIEKSKSNLLDTPDTIIKDKQTFEYKDESMDYVSHWEEKLEESLRCVEGAGKVKVMIKIKESE